MPQQRAVELDAVADQPLAVIDQQPQIELGPVELRGRERVQALLQRGAGDVERVDRVGLAALAGALARLGRQVRRDPQHPLAALDQKPLQRPRHVPAVLERPHALLVESARPLQQRRRTRGARPRPSARRAARPLPPRPRRSCANACECPRRARSLTLVLLSSTETDTWRTRLAGGDATHLSSHARHPRPATSDKTKGSQAQPGRQPQRESARRPVGTLTSASDVTDAAESKQQASMRQRLSGDHRALGLRSG